ncbi:CPBP family intramembrane glutamic endopeptidase [Fervidibacillus albus]|uniref:CPBP family intramembrane metalloprotease n=1 Tax=Fervidibacillus albus TaxID=2980026 RepID=A0A9E8LU85_9BACI|nr:CPBP family intramembrane glutamic endopeptidase [Fervidibacillus albus]WAA09607.1 CPBP family intramembrane metalloprotease [Fervidibacillus albus]
MMMMQKSWKSFFLYFGIGIISIATIYPVQKRAIVMAIENENVQLSLPVEVVTILSLMNPLFLLVIGLLLGMFLADKVQLTSFLFRNWEKGSFLTGLTKGWKQGIGSGLALGIFMISFDVLLRPWLPEVFQSSFEQPQLYDLLMAILYGGIVEEIMMRWGLMTLFVFFIWKLFFRRKSTPPKYAYIIAIVASAFFFSIGHYGATATLTEMTPLVWIRMFILNGAGGIVFGWLYWKFQLETAMIAHIFTHITMFIITMILSII